MNLRLSYTSGIILFFCIATLSFYIGWHTGLVHFGAPSIIHNQYITDFSDEKKLVGASHNVFVGRIISQGKTSNVFGGSMPVTSFQIEVLDTIKGKLSGVVNILQEGGCLDGRCFIMEGDIGRSSLDSNTGLLKEGEVYILATREDQQFGNILISHSAGKSLIQDGAKSSTQELKKNNRIKTLKKAYINETPFETDILNKDDKNAFTKLDLEQQKIRRSESEN